MYVQLRASGARGGGAPADMGRKPAGGGDDAARLAFLLGFDDVRSGGVTPTTPTASPCGPSALPADARDDAPQPASRAWRGVGLAPESLRAHARLLDAEALAGASPSASGGLM